MNVFARLDPTFGAAVRAELVARVAADTGRRRTHRRGADLASGRRWMLRGGAAVVVLTAAGTAYALSSTSPGGTEVTGRAQARTSEHTGTATLELGPRPAAATAVEIEFTCLSAGAFAFPNGSSGTCSEADLHRPASNPAILKDRYELAPGQHTITITAGPDASWRITTRYVSTRVTAWGINAKGETYGVVNDQGEPDLQAVYATNGRQGYAYTRDLNSAAGPPPTDPADALQHNRALRTGIPVPVYETDGETVIGQFLVGGDLRPGNWDDSPARPAAP